VIAVPAKPYLHLREKGAPPLHSLAAADDPKFEGGWRWKAVSDLSSSHAEAQK
jgi:hypothetical protein